MTNHNCKKLLGVILPNADNIKVSLDQGNSEILDTLADLDIGECITNPSLKAEDMKFKDKIKTITHKEDYGKKIYV